jgi:CxxC-x17-CxxC domain-containing protein
MRDRNMRDNSESFPAVCDDCGSSCTLPFKPSSDKPVYCRDCFKKKQSSNSKRPSFGGDNRSGFRRDSRANYRDRKMHPAVCDSCGNRCEVPFQPTSGKPVYCDSCFGKDGNSKRGSGSGSDRTSGGNDQLKEQITAINVKLDKIMKALEIAEPSKKSEQASKKNEQIFKKIKSEKVEEVIEPKKDRKKKEKKVAKKKPVKKVAAKKTAKKAVIKIARKKPVKKASKKAAKKK